LPATILERRALCREAEELLATHPQLTR
ncbi:lysogenization regulator HflD, partial [Acidithiobacillus ferridurans]|nr:lysogenization regulator HflD [Acidithiobacillus ferridurans]